jgi:DMSO/TMAO reductase YedYZ molybdopterin-dependent catalytic subunit
LGQSDDVVSRSDPRATQDASSPPDGPSAGPGARAGRVSPVWGGLLGLLSGAAAIGVAQLVAGILDPQTSPVITVGQASIDATPEWLKDWAISTFGSSDKQVLLGGIGAVLMVISVGLGIASIRRPAVGLWGLAVFGGVGVAAALTRPGARPIDALPSIAGAVAGAFALLVLRRALVPQARPTAEPPDAGSIDRRRFLLAGGAVAVAAALSGGVGGFFGRRFRADASRAEVQVPEPVSPAGTAAGTDLDVPGLGPYFTPNDSFYRVDTALLVPAVMAEEWSLRVHGMVDREITLDYEDLLARPLIERDITLTCVSNPVGGRYAGNARWVGARLKELLEEAGVHPAADQLVSRSVDGFTVGTPTAIVMDGRDAMLAVSMNGEPLPIKHGFPVRMIVPGLYGYVSATKWVVDLELTTFDAFDPYWIERGWAEQAPIKTAARIDTPTQFADLSPGPVPVAGVAWAQHRGIERVELRVGEGPWMQAELAAADTIDTWRQWVVMWDATPGEHRMEARATDGTGEVQTEERARPFPDGASGYHSVIVRVA